MAFCYYHSRKDNEAKGWIYIKDIIEIKDERKYFTVSSAARTMTLEAQNQAEHVLWLQTLINCSNGAASPKSGVATPKPNESKTGSDHKPIASDAQLPSRPALDIKSSSSLHSRDQDDKPRAPSVHRQQQSQQQADGKGSQLSRARINRGPSDEDLAHPSRAALTREDHRLQHSRGSAEGTVSGRLNKYISGDRRDDAMEEVILNDGPQRPRRAMLAKKAQRQQRSDRHSGSHSSDDDDDHHHNHSDNYDNDNEVEDNNDGSDIDDNGNEAADHHHHRDDDDDAKPVVPSTTRNSGHKDIDSKDIDVPRPTQPSRPPPPSAAPPRRARDAMAEIETQRARRSLDDFLYRKESSTESKSEESKQQGGADDDHHDDHNARGNGNNNNNSSDEDESFDLKVCLS
jgi:hypothetical protein